MMSYDENDVDYETPYMWISRMESDDALTSYWVPADSGWPMLVMLTSVGGNTMSSVTLVRHFTISTIIVIIITWTRGLPSTQVLISDIRNSNNNISSTQAYHHHDHLSSDLVEMGSDILLLLAWQVNTVPRSSRCKGPTWGELSHLRQLRSFHVSFNLLIYF